jgi:hypothetical protein
MAPLDMRAHKCAINEVTQLWPSYFGVLNRQCDALLERAGYQRGHINRIVERDGVYGHDCRSHRGSLPMNLAPGDLRQSPQWQCKSFGGNRQIVQHSLGKTFEESGAWTRSRAPSK